MKQRNRVQKKEANAPSLDRFSLCILFSVPLSCAPFLIMHPMNANANMQANVDEYLASHENVRLRLRMNGNREEKKITTHKNNEMENPWLICARVL